MSSLSLFIHAGLHKTATTYLQKKVFPVWPGVHYIGKPYGGSIFESLVNSQKEVALISSEQLSAPPLTPKNLDVEKRKGKWYQRREMSLERLRMIFPGSKLILSVRNPLEYVESVYSQYVSWGGAVSTSEFYSTSGEMTPFCSNDLDFYMLKDSLLRIWGEDNFLLFDSGELQSRPEDVYLNLANFMGVSEVPEVIDKGRSNVRLSESEVNAMLAYSRKHHAQYGTKEFFSGLKDVKKSSTSDQPFSFPQDTLSKVRNDTWASWVKLKEELARHHTRP